MNIFKRMGLWMIVGTFVVCGSEVGERLAIPGVHSMIPSAGAVVGRPLTPVSVAGVARRNNRHNRR
ncbi:MAG: hypothetical protein ACKVKR_12410 [Pseudomonadales bacterium]|jgi:hypothetical protein